MWPTQFSAKVLSVVTCLTSQLAGLQTGWSYGIIHSNFTKVGIEALACSALLVVELAREPRLHDSKVNDLFPPSVILS